jgi:hypothetical protein
MPPGELEPGIIEPTFDPMVEARSLTCSTTRLITLRTSGRRAAATPAPTAAAAPVATAARRTTFFIFLFAAVFFPPFRPAADRLAEVELRFFADFLPELLRADDLFFDDFFDERLLDDFFDFFEERFFAAMGHSPFQSVGVGESVT